MALSKRILLIEDDRDISSTLRGVLESAGHQVTAAPNGVEGQKLIQAGEPDLVITGFSSYSITVKNQGNAAAGPFSVSATNYPALRSQGLAAGASQTFVGPGCVEGNYHAFADTMFEVAESNENNNSADTLQVC